jgi:hypothetical protein
MYDTVRADTVRAVADARAELVEAWLEAHTACGPEMTARMAHETLLGCAAGHTSRVVVEHGPDGFVVRRVDG